MTALVTHPRRFAPPLKGQCWQPGKAGSAALWVVCLASKDFLS